MKVRIVTNESNDVIECEDLQIFAHTAECCAIKFLYKETGKNEEGVTVRKIIRVVFGITSYSFE